MVMIGDNKYGKFFIKGVDSKCGKHLSLKFNYLMVKN
jgi:hypothetical protein